MANYVKFLRGTPTAYANLVKKDDDTLYFIYEKDKSNGVLYLGSKLIADSTDSGIPSNPILSLDELSDVIINELGEEPSLLVYDKNSQAWINKDLDELIFIGATKNSSGQSGLVPAPDAQEESLFLRGDGTWAAPSVNHTILTLDNNNSVMHDVLLSENEGNAISGDIIIIRDLIADDKWKHTAYVFSDGVWHAMDGNYNAENIYFDADFVFTKEFGRYKPDSSGSVTVPAKGVNLRELLEDAYSLEEKEGLIIEEPAATINGSVKYYEIGTTGTQDITVSLNSDGAYKYGYSENPTSGEEGDVSKKIVNNGVTGVGADVSLDAPYELKFNGVAVSPKEAKGAVFTLNPEVQLESVEMSAQGTVHHTQGYIPVSNLGKIYPSERIAAGTKVSSSQVRAKWYIPMYQGFTYADSAIADPATITANELVTLAAPSASTNGAVNKITGSKAYDKNKTITATASKSWRQYFLAFPADYNWEMANAKDSNNIDCTVRKAADVTLTFGEGEKTADVVYSVYYIHNAADYGTLKINWTM